MKKFITVCAALLIGASALFAQSPYDHSSQWNVSVTGGGLFSGSENYFSYKENGRFYDLINWQGAISVGYDFSNIFGTRLWVGYGKNAGAGNVRQTAAHGFYPYTFKSVSTFADATLSILGLAEEVGPLTPKFYAGIGLGYSWDMTRSKRNNNAFNNDIHPWQNITNNNLAFGFRLGAMLEYDFGNNLGILVDMNAEAYIDNFSGLRPFEDDIDEREGYAGFPLDLRAYASIGLIYHF